MSPIVEEGRGGLPVWIVLPVQLAALIWELGVVAIVTLPWWSVIAFFAVADWVLDWVFLLTIGWWCGFCSGIFIWTLNILHLPITILGWIQRFYYETFGLLIDGWLLIFNFSGCYLFLGRHCWTKGGFPGFLNPNTFLDIPFLTTDREQSFVENMKQLVVPPQP